MSATKFGESFAPDKQSRVNILEKEEILPEYVDFSRDIRRLLRSNTEGVDYNQRENWPECPQGLRSLEDLLIAAKNEVTDRWQEVTSELLEKRYQEWLAQIPDTEDNQEIRDILSDPQALDEKIKIQQLGKLEGMRVVLPEAWRNLVLMSSERQLATLSLLRYWVKEKLTDADIEAMGTNKIELELMLDAGGILGKYVDHAYVKQIELADQPGGTTASSLSKKTGGTFVYEDRSEGRMIRRAYADVFPGEYSRITHGLEVLLRKVEKLIASQKLPETYNDLPAYLEQLIEIYSSKETSLEVLDKKRGELDIKMKELAEAGCPLMFIVGGTSGATGDADKVDVDLRFGIITESLKELDQEIVKNTAIAQRIVDENIDSLNNKNFRVPKLILNTQPFAFGSNLQFFTSAESGELAIVSHVNVNNEVARIHHPALIQKLFPEKFKTLQLSDYLQAVNDDTSRHEIGHSIMYSDDQGVLDRIGSNSQADILEELKAETASLLFTRERMKTMQPEEASRFAEEQFFTKVIVISDYLANKSDEAGTDGEAYYYTGLAIADELLRQGVLVEDGGGYQIIDAQKGVDLVATMAESLLRQFYLNIESSPQDVKKYIRGLKKRTEDPVLSNFIAKLKK